MKQLYTLLLLACLPARLLAQDCPAPDLPAECEALVAGTPLPYPNPSAPARLPLAATGAIDIVILGHSESRRYERWLQPLLDQNPPLPNTSFKVVNRYIGGHEAWRWARPGQRGYQTIEDIIQNSQNPVIVFGLFSNNVSFPIQTAAPDDPDRIRFSDELLAIADHLHNGGSPTLMVYLSAHRYKVTNTLPAWYENCAIELAMQQANATGKNYVKPGPEQHDLHWCVFPSHYHPDQVHTNQLGEMLMAETWYNFLVRELTGAASVPYGAGTPSSSNRTPVLKPAGGFPMIGNSGFRLRTIQATPNTPLSYHIGRAPGTAGPLLVRQVVRTLAGTSDTSGEHTLSLPIPNRAALKGRVFYVQSSFQDSGTSSGLAATQGLALHIAD